MRGASADAYVNAEGEASGCDSVTVATVACCSGGDSTRVCDVVCFCAIRWSTQVNSVKIRLPLCRTRRSAVVLVSYKRHTNLANASNHQVVIV